MKPKDVRDQVATLRRLAPTVAAFLLSLSPRSLRERAGAPRRKDGTFDGPVLVSWFLAEVLEKRRGAAGASKNLERLRKIRAQREERRLGVETGSLVDLRAVLSHFRSTMVVVHEVYKSMEHKYGRQLSDTLNTALDEAMKIFFRGWPEGDKTDEAFIELGKAAATRTVQELREKAAEDEQGGKVPAAACGDGVQGSPAPATPAASGGGPGDRPGVLPGGPGAPGEKKSESPS